MTSIRSKLKNFTLFDKLLIALGIVGVIFLAYIFFRKSAHLTVTIKVGSDNVLYESNGIQSWFSQLFYTGMTEKDGLGTTRAQVLKVYSYDTSPTRRAVYLTTKLKVVYNRASDQYTYKGYPVLVGSTLRLYLDRMLVDGLITHVEGMRDPRERKTLIVKTQVREETSVFPETAGTKDYIANALLVGDEIKDGQGNTIIKILDKQVEDAKKTVTTSDGRILLQSDPVKKDVYLTLQIEAIKMNNKYFLFDDVPIQIGIGVPFESTFVSVWPDVMSITIVK